MVAAIKISNNDDDDSNNNNNNNNNEIKGESLPYTIPLRHSGSRGKCILFFNFVALSPGKGTSTHFTGSWAGFGPVLDGYGKSRPHRGSYGGCPAHGESLYRLSCLPPQHRGADKSLARPGRKQVTATEDFEFHVSYLYTQLEEYL